MRRSSTSSPQGDPTQEILEKVEVRKTYIWLHDQQLNFIQKIFDVNSSTLKSPIGRPTKIMRELYKNSKHDVFKWKDVIEPNEPILKGKAVYIYIYIIKEIGI